MEKSQKVFHASRRDVFRRIIGKNSIAIIFSATPESRSYDDTHTFKQNKNFWYLTGFAEPNSAVVILPNEIILEEPFSKRKIKTKEILFTLPKNSIAETWNGERLGSEKVKSALGISTGLSIEHIPAFISKYFGKYSHVYINIDVLYNLTSEMKSIMSNYVNDMRLRSCDHQISDANFILSKMRRKKHEYEISQMRKAIEISAKGYHRVLTTIKPGDYEYQVQAELEYLYKFNGASDVAYRTIAASGNNACCLHYESNSEKMKDGDVIVIDSGAEYNMYNADITRSFPINGKFNKHQRFIYQIILAANKECIKRAVAGVSLKKLSEFSAKFIAVRLKKANLLKDLKKVKEYTLHSLGHHIGLDTHDAVPYGDFGDENFDLLKEGDVITIEPGVYFRENDTTVPKVLCGFGVRIEDNILIKKKGNENLSVAIPKEPDEIEKIMSGSN